MNKTVTGTQTALLMIAGVAILMSLPYWTTPAIVFLVGLTLIDAVFALSWNLMFGFTGMTTFGHAAFLAIGAYMAALILKSSAGMHYLLVLLMAATVGAVLAGLVGAIILRRATGIALAILTMAIGEILRIVLGYSVALGREDGMSGIPRPVLDLGLVSIDLQAGHNYYWFLCIVCALVAAGLCWLTFSRFGRVLRSIRQDAERTSFLGVNVARYRLISFTIAGAIGTFAGALYASWVQTITPELSDTFHSAQPMLNALLGGAQSFWGPVIGTAVFAVVNFSTRTFAGLSELIVGTVLLVVILVAPSGIMGLVKNRLFNRDGADEQATAVTNTAGQSRSKA